MKRSEELKIQAQSEDNDLKALGLECKALREHRWENIKQNYIDKFTNNSNILSFIEKEESFVLDTLSYKRITFYPKANKILIHSTSKWIKPGLSWIIKNIL